MILLTADPAYTQFVAARAAEATLMRASTVRDLGGPVFGLKRAIDEGHRRAEDLSVGSGHLADIWSWRLPDIVGAPARHRRPTEPIRDRWFRGHRWQSR